ncbi:hypothetical protein IscW_ISCW022733 [Ixodes scapularis]|uniref:Uncharacterized protein n=1 Tax=Ixodes scapularis TaxID=6945 RepID=B7QDN9_IXOSC|nr:hypothetical protein IscW_ISCW022733 [Ixodes scapularis]|eukprot:XP_002413653.1 hypothetical protein IscW_ISCW022733 [Ixodes scapularis]
MVVQGRAEEPEPVVLVVVVEVPVVVLDLGQAGVAWAKWADLHQIQDAGVVCPVGTPAFVACKEGVLDEVRDEDQGAKEVLEFFGVQGLVEASAV